MRITEPVRQTLVTAVHSADAQAKIWLFGSRVDDSKKGGDIDIAILSRTIKLAERMRIRRYIVDTLGEQKIDMVVSADAADPFFRLALEKAVRLDE